MMRRVVQIVLILVECFQGAWTNDKEKLIERAVLWLALFLVGWVSFLSTWYIWGFWCASVGSFWAGLYSVLNMRFAKAMGL